MFVCSKKVMFDNGSLFQKIFFCFSFQRSIPIGDEVMEEFMMFSLGVPLSKKYFTSCCLVLEKRMKKVLEINPVLRNLSEETKRELAQTSFPVRISILQFKEMRLCFFWKGETLSSSK